MVGGVFYSWMANQRNGAGGDTQAEDKPAFHLDGKPISERIVNSAVQAQSSQSNQPGSKPFEMKASAYSGIIDEAMTEAALISLVTKMGAKTDDATLLATGKAQFEEQIEGQRMQMEMNKKLKPNATPAEFDAEIKKMTGGKSLADIRKSREDSLRSELKDPKQREAVIGQLARQLLQEVFRSKRNPTDAEVRSSYDVYQYLQLLVSDNGGIVNAPGKASPKVKVDERIAAAQKDLKAGVPFEQVVDKYTTQPMIGKKKPSENFIDYPVNSIKNDTQLKSLLTLKPGQVSDVLTTPMGKSIYKLVKIKSNLPKDYDKSKDKYKKEYLDPLVSEDLQKAIDETKKSPGFIKFDAPGFKAIYDVQQAKSPMGMQIPGKTTTAQQWKDLDAEAQAAFKKNLGFDETPAVLAWYVAFNAMWDDPTSDKAKLRPERIEMLNAILQHNEDFDIRMDLVNAYLEDKKNDEAAQQLLQASTNNASFDPTGFDRFNKVRDQLNKMQLDKSITDANATLINNAQLEWSKNRTVWEEEEKKVKAEKEQADKEMEAERAAAAKAKAEADKAAAKNPPTTGSTAGGGTATTTASAIATSPKPGSPVKVITPGNGAVPNANGDKIPTGATPKPGPKAPGSKAPDGKTP